MLKQAALHNRRETGGILIGHIADDLATATIEYATGPPRDSRHKPTSFVRGLSGLTHTLNTWWRRDRFHYLGEWHTHPSSAPYPSMTDKTQMKNIAADSGYDCPTPILVILGGTPDSNLAVTVSVFDGLSGQLINLVLETNA